MDATTVMLAQCGLSLWGISLVVQRFVMPALSRYRFEDALCLFCLFHSFRYVALGVFAPGHAAPFAAGALVIASDLTSPALALIAAGMLYARLPGAILMAWVFNLVGLADLAVSFPHAIQVRVAGAHLGLAWHAFIYYVPALFVTHLVMLDWLYLQPARGSRERLAAVWQA